MLDKIKLIWSAIVADAKDSWNRCKVPILAIGAIIVALEFDKIKEALLVYSGKKEIQKDQTKDASLAKDEKAANDQADALVQEAKDLPSQNGPIADDWNKK